MFGFSADAGMSEFGRLMVHLVWPQQDGVRFTARLTPECSSRGSCASVFHSRPDVHDEGRRAPLKPCVRRESQVFEIVLRRDTREQEG